MEQKEDEEITIDFSKIKNKVKDFFKRDKIEDKAEEKKLEQSKEENKDEELDLSFDFSKIKKFFKSDEKETGKDEDVEINWGKVIEFFKKYGVIFIALIPILLSIYIRMQAGILPITDDWARNSVINSITSQIRTGIDQQYPNLPSANKDEIANRELQKIIDKNKAQIDEQIKATSIYFKSFFQDENGKRYMPDIDPYYWTRYAENILEHRHPGDLLKNNKPYDNLQSAPVGRFVFPDMLHSYSLAYFYKFLSFFAPSLTLIQSAFYLPIVISALCIILIFLIGRKIAGNIGGFFAALMLTVNGAFLSRTLHPDNDVWVVFFPLVITWLFVEAIEIKKTTRVILLTAFAGFLTGMFTFAWSGWWYIFDFLLATIAMTCLYLVITNFKGIKANPRYILSNIELKNILIVGFLYFFLTAAFVTLFSGWSTFRNSFIGPLSFPSIKAPVEASLWPNVLTTVAELNEGSIDGIINSVGGKFLFYISLLGLLLSISRAEGIRRFDFGYILIGAGIYGTYFLLRWSGFNISVFGLLLWIMLPILLRIGISIYQKDSSYDFKLSILLSLWIVSTIFASIKGIRFTLLLAPAFSVAFGVALGRTYTYLSKLLAKELKIHKAVVSSILIVLLLLIYVNPTRGAISSAGSDLPIINDAWYNALTAIKKGSSEDAIITSWWDFGHHFKSIAERRVTFDGTTQTTPAAHWVGKILMTDNEAQAIGILRMLDCGSNNAFNALYSVNNDTHLSLKILNEIILLDKKKAGERLKELKFDEKQIEKILSLTHCEPPSAYFIASEDMIGKSGVWSHFGSWNFERADLWQNARKMPQESAVNYMIKKFNYTRERAENIYSEIQSITSDSAANSWVAPWPGYAGVIRCNKNENKLYICQQYRVGTDNGGRDIYVNFNVNLSNYEVFGNVGNTLIKPSIVAFTTETGLVIKEVNESNLGLGITFVPLNENELEAIISSKELTGSMFTKMFYMQGHGLKHFKLFEHQRGLTGTDIYTYKVDWEGKNTTIVPDYASFFKEPEPVKEENLIENTSEENSNDKPNIIENTSLSDISNKS